MRPALGYLVLVAVSAVTSWWLLLGSAPLTGTVVEEPERVAALVLEPGTAAPSPAVAEPKADSDSKPASDPEPQPSPPPAEAGDPDGESDLGDAVDQRELEREAEEKPEEIEPEVASGVAMREEMKVIAASKELLRRAEDEVRGFQKRGFRTVLLCSARDQLDIARFFGEPVVLVPRSGLDPRGGHYHRLAPGAMTRVETIRKSPPLERYRQYRDLFAFSYESLPKPLRELRRKVFVRGDVYLFAVLIPATEWGLVISRREAALAHYNRGRPEEPRSLGDVRRFTLRYLRLPGNAFDLQVTEILFADGERWSASRS